MDSKEEHAIRGGVITSYDVSSQKYECMACGRQGCGDLGAHLNSKEHNNSLVWEAVRNPSASQYLLQNLPEEVQMAKKNNEIEVVDKEVFTYKCKVCDGKRPFSGLASLVSHLTGKEHMKTKKNKHIKSLLSSQSTGSAGQVVPTSSPQPTILPQPGGYGFYSIPSQQPPTSVHHSYAPVCAIVNTTTPQPGLVGYHPSQTPPQFHAPSYHMPSHVTPPPRAQQPQIQGLQRTDIPGGPLQPPLANYFIGQYQHNYDSSCRPSMVAPSLTTTAQTPYNPPSNSNHSSPGPFAQLPHTPPQGPSATVQPHQPSDMMPDQISAQPPSSDNTSTVVSSTTDSNGGGSGEPGKRFDTDFIVSEHLSTECVEALNAGIVTRTTIGFNCNACFKPMTGAMPLFQHVNSDKHKKKVQLWRSNLATQADSRTISADTAIHIPPPQLRHDRAVSWIVKGCSSPKEPSDMVYQNLSDPRGLVLIFNYHLKGSHERKGAVRDSFTLTKLFTDMGYEVRLHEDLTKQQTIDTLEKIQADPILDKVDCFIVFILSHGTGNLIFVTADKPMSLDDLRYSFVNGACPSLKSKPKLFFANFCRGQYYELAKQLQHDYIATSDNIKEAPQDMVTWHASINDFKALRDYQEGTVFAQALCEVFAEHAHNTELFNLYLKVNNRMREKEGTTPEQQSYNFKHFYFNPK